MIMQSNIVPIIKVTEVNNTLLLCHIGSVFKLISVSDFHYSTFLSLLE